MRNSVFMVFLYPHWAVWLQWALIFTLCFVQLFWGREFFQDKKWGWLAALQILFLLVILYPAPLSVGIDQGVIVLIWLSLLNLPLGQWKFKNDRAQSLWALGMLTGLAYLLIPAFVISALQFLG